MAGHDEPEMRRKENEINDPRGHCRRSQSSRLSSAASAQEDCPRGTLDKAYCDRNGDLTADLPADPKKVLNPSTLIFS